MGRAKQLIIKRIDSRSARAFIRRHHYSGKVVPNSSLHFGAFLDDGLHGVLSLGPSMDKRKLQGLVANTGWNEFIELNRMAFDDALPRNSESRAMAIVFKLLRRHCPHIKWVVSFADATQCGDGTIYRAAGFVLTGLRHNKNIAKLPSGRVVHKMVLQSSPLIPRVELDGKSYADAFNGSTSFDRYLKHTGAHVCAGFQLRYIYFLHPGARKLLQVKEIPFSKISELGAAMYRGQKRVASIDSDVPGDQPGEGGASPTATLHNPADKPTL